MNIKNALVYIAVLVCVLFSALRIRKFYRMNFPVANEGECVKLHIKDVGSADARVFNNYPEKRSSLLVIYRVNQTPILFPVLVSYESQRAEFHEEREECR